MLDIHYHLLFGVDDGPKTIEASLELAEASVAEGVTHIVCTPHSNDRYPFRPEVNRDQLTILNEHLAGRVTLGLGCDFHLSYENIEDARRNPAKYTINNLQYLLVEFPEFAISPAISDVLYDLCANGIVPIVTHPERNPVLLAHPERMIAWLRSGCLIQLTAASLTGRFGKRAEAFCHDLLKRNWVHLIASDAHNLAGRAPAMGPAHDCLKRCYGRETADRLCIHNPRAVFFGQTLPPNPEPLGLHNDLQRKRSFFLRAFGRNR